MNHLNTPPDSSPSTPTPTAFARLCQRPSSIAEQISTFTAHGEDYAIEDLPRISVKRNLYVQEASVDRRANAKRYSWIGDHGVYLVKMDGNRKLNTFWSCTECDRLGDNQLYDTGTTSNAERHLLNRHRIRKPGSTIAVSPSPNVIAMQRLGAKRRKISDIPTTADAGDLFRRTLVRWMVKANIPLIGPEDEEFRNLIEIASLGSNNLVDLVPTGDTMRRWILKEFDDRKAEIKSQLLHDAQSKIHLSFDLWTSDGTTMSLMAVVAHYLDKSFINRTRLLAMRRLFGSHSGENMSKVLVGIIQEFELTDRLGYFMIDNADSNDTCLEHLIREIFPRATEDDVDERRLRCRGHVLNLVAKAFLFGTDADAFELEDEANTTLEREQERLKSCRKKGPVGKMHNIIVFIRASTQRQELFKNICLTTIEEIDGLLINDDTKYLGVVKDNTTRWNSTYLMITRALEKRQVIDALIQVLDVRHAEKRVPCEARLSAEDWLILTETAYILKPVYDRTMRFQSRAKEGHHGAVWEVLPSMEIILRHLETLKTQYAEQSPTQSQRYQILDPQDLPHRESLPPQSPAEEPTIAQNTRRAANRRPVGYQPPSRRTVQSQNPPPGDPRPGSIRCRVDEDLSDAGRQHFRIGMNNAWVKLNKYYNRTDRSSAYFGSVRMHPALNAAWFVKNWKGVDQLQWLQTAEERLRVHYGRSYRDRETNVQHQNVSPPYPTHEPNEYDDFLTPATFYAQRTAVDEYDRYKSLYPIKDAFRKPLDWWRDHLDEYPTLFRMALGLYSVPAMSSECNT